LTVVTADRIAKAAKREFDNNAGLAEYLLWNVCLQVCTWLGDDPNSPAPDLGKVQAGLLAPLKSWLASDRSFRDPAFIAATLEAVRDTLH
jgi:hypothetical protein